MPLPQSGSAFAARPHFLRLPAALAAGGALALLASTPTLAVDLVNIDFDTQADFTGNFRELFHSGVQPISVNTTDQSLQFAAVSSYIHTFDATPADGVVKSTFNLTPGGAPLVVSMNFSVPTANSSIGAYIINAAAEATASSYLALLNVNNAGSSDLIRFSSNANPTASSNAGTLNTGTFSSSDAVALNTSTSLTLTYAINASNQGVLTLSAGGFSDSTTFAGTALSNVEIGWRLSAATGTGQFKLNDFAISQGAPIPEPSAYGLLLGMTGLGASVLVRRRTAAR